MTGGPWLVVGIGIIVVVLASVMLMFAPALADLRGRGRGRSHTAEPPPPGVRRPNSYAGSLIKGFGYMFASRRRPRRRMDSVGLRFDRAMTRIDTVDPYDAQRGSARRWWSPDWSTRRTCRRRPNCRTERSRPAWRPTSLGTNPEDQAMKERTPGADRDKDPLQV